MMRRGFWSPLSASGRRRAARLRGGGGGGRRSRPRPGRPRGRPDRLPQAILDRVHAEFTGHPVEIELDDDDGRFIYKVKLLAPGGAIVKLEYDARDARLLRAKGRGADAARRPRQD